ncbi:MAG: SET domain-containing protein-lysine N-methyltransferase, partial [Candidatus Thiodiazotropha sp.]
HPLKELKGRLLNHARGKMANLAPKTAELEGRPVVLFVATKAIEKCEELLFDYICKGDSASHQEDWM